MSRSKIEKYAIHASRWEDHHAWTWWARVPYGTFQRFRSWQEAADYLRLRWELRQDNKTWRRR